MARAREGLVRVTPSEKRQRDRAAFAALSSGQKTAYLNARLKMMTDDEVTLLFRRIFTDPPSSERA